MTGRFVAFVGLPGAGKSTVCAAFAALVGGAALQEPVDWPPVVTDPGSANGFSALTWFRAMRVPLYHQAVRERERGRVAVLDTYYDKICADLLGAPGMDWFLAPDDPYFDVYQEIARRDWAALPGADVIVSFQLSEPTWRLFLARRNRELDRSWGVAGSFAIQRHFTAAAERSASETGAPLLRFTQEVSSPEAAAARLLAQLRDEQLW